MKRIILSVIISIYFFVPGHGQNIQRIAFNAGDSASGYYLAVPPASGNCRAALVVFCSFRGPESILPETKLHNVAFVNGILTVYASLGTRVLPDKEALDQIDRVFKSIATQFKADTASFAVGGFDFASMAVLRYAEQAWSHPGEYAVRPRAVFNIGGPVDLAGLVQLCKRQVRKNFFPPAVGDARAILRLVEKGEDYAPLSPFSSADTTPGNEQALRHVAVRMYFDTDIDWQLKTRRNSYYDTYLPDATELVSRLLLEGNDRAEFIPSKVHAVRSNGTRGTVAYNIVDETDCIQWISKELHVFNPAMPFAYSGPYEFEVPDKWRVERSSFPPAFAPQIKLKGIEEMRFPPGWGVASSNEYWSVAYLLWLDAGQTIDEASLQEMLYTYYEGLVVNGGGPVAHQIPADKKVPTKVQLKKIKPEQDDLETYAGTIDMLDYMGMKPMRLNCLVHVKACDGGSDDHRHIPVFFEISPKPFTDILWSDLKRMKQHFSCTD